MNRLEKALRRYQSTLRELNRNEEFNLLEDCTCKVVNYLKDNLVNLYCYISFTSTEVTVATVNEDAVLFKQAYGATIKESAIKFYLETIERAPEFSNFLLVDSNKLRMNLLR